VYVKNHISIYSEPKEMVLAVTDVTKLPLTFLTTDHGQSSLPPPPSSVFVVSDTQGPFRSASLSLYFFSTFVLASAD